MTVVTVFTAGPDDDRTTEWDADTGVTSAARMLQRAAENEAALALAGRTAANLGLRESQYDGGAVDPELLRPYLHDAETVYVPSGTGAEIVNPEHVVVRDACLALRSDAVLYADNPYWHFSPALSLPVVIGRERSIVELVPTSASEWRRRSAATQESSPSSKRRTAPAPTLRCCATRSTGGPTALKDERSPRRVVSGGDACVHSWIRRPPGIDVRVSRRAQMRPAAFQRSQICRSSSAVARTDSAALIFPWDTSANICGIRNRESVSLTAALK